MKKVDSKGLTEKEFLAQYNPDKYPKPSLTADILIFKKNTEDNTTELLLIRRKGHPFIGCWALPGGFAERGETIGETAKRELEEETGVKGLTMELVGVYSKPGRDPRGWTVSVAYMAVVNDRDIKAKAGDDAEDIGWGKLVIKKDTLKITINGRSINSKLAFDHYEIISDAVKKLFLISQKSTCNNIQSVLKF